MMQTLTLNIQESFVQDFLTIIEHYKDKVQLKKDKNLELDPYFYKRQKQLQLDIEDIDSGKVKMFSEEEYNSEMSAFFKKLESKYED
jgi:hypothetical protein